MQPQDKVKALFHQRRLEVITDNKPARLRPATPMALTARPGNGKHALHLGIQGFLEKGRRESAGAKAIDLSPAA
jgi:hypothetical protein